MGRWEPCMRELSATQRCHASTDQLRMVPSQLRNYAGADTFYRRYYTGMEPRTRPHRRKS
jgi:hypothetical protein